MDPFKVARLAQILATLVGSLAFIRLIVIKSYAGLPVLTFYLAFQIIQGVVSFSISQVSYFYRFTYAVSEPLAWIFSFLMVREIYHLAFSGYKGISSLTRVAAYVAGLLAFGLCAFVLWKAGPSGLLARGTAVMYEIFWEKWVSFTLSAFIVLMLFLVSRYPVSLNRDLAVHLSIFSTNFLGSFLIVHLFTSSDLSEQAWRNTGVSLLSAGCFACWALLLKSPRSIRVPRDRPNVDPLEEQRLLMQLEGINKILVKSGRH